MMSKCRESISRVCCAVGLKTSGKKSRKVSPSSFVIFFKIFVSDIIIIIICDIIKVKPCDIRSLLLVITFFRFVLWM